MAAEMSALLPQIPEALAPAIVTIGLLAALLPWVDRRVTWHRVVMNTIAIVLMLRYLVWRWTDTLPPTEDLISFASGFVFLVAESMAMGASLITLVVMMRTRERTSMVDAALASRQAAERNFAPVPPLPLVDVFICTYSEEAVILERTILGALRMDYPRFRVWVLDDGRRPWLAQLCQTHGCGYLTRTDNRHAKAGNVNNGLAHVLALPEPPDLISVLDADFVPLPAFLSRAVTLFAEADVGIVQTPQHFTNPDPIQANLAGVEVIPDEQRFFFDCLQASNDAWDGALCCGTSSVLRVAALAKIGGMPTASVTEDYLVSLQLRANGYRTVYLNERLSLGLAPEGLSEYLTQRARWCLGFLQICNGRMSPLRPGNGLRLIDRAILISAFLHWSGNHAFRLLGVLLPPLFLLFGIQSVHAEVGATLSVFLPYYVVTIAIMMWLSAGRLLPMVSDVAQLLAARQILGSVALGLVRPWGHPFKVTMKGGNRDHAFVAWPLAREFGAYLGLTLAAIAWAFDRDSGLKLDGTTALVLVWCWYNIAMLTIALFVTLEQPRGKQRYRTREPVHVQQQDTTHPGMILDLSESGAFIAAGERPLAGSRVSLTFAGIEVGGDVVRSSDDGFAVTFDQDPKSRQSLLSHLYSGRYHCSIGEASLSQTATVVARRILR